MAKTVPNSEPIEKPNSIPKEGLMDMLFNIDHLTGGELPIEWNWLVDEYGSNDKAKLIHWTKGIPGFKEYSDAPMADKWFAAHTKANYATN